MTSEHTIINNYKNGVILGNVLVYINITNTHIKGRGGKRLPRASAASVRNLNDREGNAHAREVKPS